MHGIFTGNAQVVSCLQTDFQVIKRRASGCNLDSSDNKMFWLLQIVIFFTMTNTSWAQQIMNPPDLPYASNPPRINPPYCVGMFSFIVGNKMLMTMTIGFKITYPSKYNETPLKWGDIGFLSWQVDKNMKNPPDMITRIRLLDTTQRNLQIIGENVSKYRS